MIPVLIGIIHAFAGASAPNHKEVSVAAAKGRRGWLSEARDRFVASDPGLTRLQTAAFAAIAMATTLGIEFLFAKLRGASTQDTTVGMLLGAVLGMMGSMALGGTGVLPKVRTAVFFPVALGLGMLLGAVVAGTPDLMLGVFVVVMFAAVFVRRFGPAFFFYGFMLWMGYFFAAFLHATVAMLPIMLASIAIATVWVLLLSCTVLRTNPRRTLNRTVRAFGARARAVARICAEVTELDPAASRQVERWRRRLQAHQNRLAETALMVEGWSAEQAALPDGWSASALRRHIVNVQLAIGELGSAVAELVGADAETLRRSAHTAELIARRDYQAAEAAARALLEWTDQDEAERLAGWWAARHLAAAVITYVGAARDFYDVIAGEDGEVFEPAVTLVMGGILPGSAVSAGTVEPRGGRWNPLTRLDFTSRQAVQVAVAGGLAILLGRELSTTRYYWAVIAAFIAFTGTATRSETFIKAVNRVLGTLVGLVAGIGLAHLTAGHTTWVLVVIVASMFCGFYLVRVSYAYMIFFITIMVSQLYSVLHEFSSDLLVLRLEETAIGAAIGILVALLLTPLSTRDTVGSAQASFLGDLAELLRAAAGALDGAHGHDLDAVARGLDDRLRQLQLVAGPLTRALLWGNDPQHARRRLTLFATCAHYSRALVAAVRRSSVPAGGLANASLALADTATALAEVLGPPGGRPAVAGEALQAHLADADVALFSRSPQTRPRHAAHRPLIHLHQLLTEVAAIAPEQAGVERYRLATITGRVRSTSGIATQGASLTLIDPSGRQVGRADTNDDGRYRLVPPSPGTYLLVAVAPAHGATATQVIVAGKPVLLDITLTGVASLTGTVIGGPASVTLVDAAGEVSAVTQTDPDGGFSFAKISPGTYNLAITADDHCPVVRAVTLAEDESAREDVELRRLAELAGAAYTDCDGRPVADARITLIDQDGHVVAETDTDDTGRYRLAELAAGEYTVVAEGFPAVTEPVRIRHGQPVTLDVELRHPPRESHTHAPESHAQEAEFHTRGRD
jgi:uncharacterized membrane protein YccC